MYISRQYCEHTKYPFEKKSFYTSMCYTCTNNHT